MNARAWWTLGVALLAASSSNGESRALDFESGWEISGEGATVEPFMGASALRMRSGRAIARDVRFEDGTIEFDVETTGQRSFFYVQFRMQEDGEHEELYFRPHKSNLPDAIQYTPVYRGEGNWQLYHGEGCTAAAGFPPGEWFHLKVVVSGPRAAVFVGDVTEPQLVVPLVRSSAAGYVALRSFLPAGQPDRGYPTSFANVVVRPGEVDYDFSSAPAAETELEGLVREWLVSEAVDAVEGAVRALPRVTGWRKLEADASGLVVFGRDIARPEGSRRSTALAGLTLTSEKAGRFPFQLGFSDEVSVFLNGTLLFSADDSYSFDAPRREGLIGLDQVTIYLPLRAGENELVLAVTDFFGGWGVMGRIESSGDVEVSPRYRGDAAPR